ncbi:unnamed protein product [Ranitomeya imitator]|uniref:Dual specificity phosphatase 29 n=1 Tax=Ranitomeya imitator TaxID=111125 RepID=A0ABN9LNJ3_9NEOB|nr:unnamed protein product [Ranitomeya imitator]
MDDSHFALQWHFYWSHSSAMSFLYTGDQNYAKYSKCGRTTDLYRGLAVPPVVNSVAEFTPVVTSGTAASELPPSGVLVIIVIELCFRKTALDRYSLEKNGFTHVLNAAHGRWNVDTGAEYYSDMIVEYYGVEAADLPSFDLSQFFYPAAEFIHMALNKSNNKVLVHCAMGRSRSASLVLAYLMIYEKMTVVDAITQVLKHRCILPNRGFLKQLRQLDIQLALERRAARDGENSFDKSE